jgi:chromosome segregation ATPase
MARPIPTNHDGQRGSNGTNGSLSRLAELGLERVDGADVPVCDPDNWDDDGPTPTELKRENAQLRKQVAEVERLLHDLKQEAEQALTEQQREFEAILEEKSELIRNLHLKLQQTEGRPAVPPAALPREEELMALSEELERERRQLKEDEEALMQQMAQMEVQMSRERAELARQRTELVRLQSEIRHELELAARDAALRERLAPLQRRSQDLARKVSGTGAATPQPEEPAEPAPEPPANPRRDSGLFRRFFG